LYLCTLLKRTTSIRASAGPQRPTHRPPLTTLHPPRTIHTTTHTSLPTTHCPPLANACFFRAPPPPGTWTPPVLPLLPGRLTAPTALLPAALTATPAAPPQPNPLAAASRLSGRCYVPPCTIRWPTTPACSRLPSSPLHCPHTSQEHGLLKHPMPMRAIS
jgi:hypothetical protein